MRDGSESRGPTSHPSIYQPNYCDTHPGACGTGPDEHLKKDTNAVKEKMVVDGFYLGGQYPQTLAEMEEDIYQGNAVDLIDSLSTRQDDVNNSYGIPNVYAGFTYSQYENGSIDVTGITVANASDYRVFVFNVIFTAGEKQLTMGLGSPSLNQEYAPDPLRIVSQTNSDKFMTIDPHTSQTMSLVPSGNPINPSNHFGPSSIQSLTIRVLFFFKPEPNSQVLTFDLLP